MFKVSPFHEEYGLNVVRCNMCSIMLGFPVPLRLYNVWGRGEIRDKAEAFLKSRRAQDCESRGHERSTMTKGDVNIVC